MQWILDTLNCPKNVTFIFIKLKSVQVQPKTHPKLNTVPLETAEIMFYLLAHDKDVTVRTVPPPPVKPDHGPGQVSRLC